ncbi:hypothetical protein B0H14DRAFT_3490938 [Mycena olivaceomarginata]|nr:hypothetical protein B0H14DRAFT_3490938 [Mycena olivaceomarginata]
MVMTHTYAPSPSRGNGLEQLAIALLHEPLDLCIPVSEYAAVEPCLAFDPPRPLNWRPRLHLSATNLLRDTSSCSNKCSSAVYHPVNPHERGPLGCPHAQALGGGHEGSTPERFRAILATARALAPFSSSPGPARLRCDRATVVTGCFGYLALPALAGAGSEWRRFSEGSPTRARARRRHGTCAQYATPRNDGRVERGARSVLHSAPWSVRAQGMEIAPPRRLAGPYPHTTGKRWSPLSELRVVHCRVMQVMAVAPSVPSKRHLCGQRGAAEMSKGWSEGPSIRFAQGGVRVTLVTLPSYPREHPSFPFYFPFSDTGWATPNDRYRTIDRELREGNAEGTVLLSLPHAICGITPAFVSCR